MHPKNQSCFGSSFAIAAMISSANFLVNFLEPRLGAILASARNASNRYRHAIFHRDPFRQRNLLIPAPSLESSKHPHRHDRPRWIWRQSGRCRNARAATCRRACACLRENRMMPPPASSRSRIAFKPGAPPPSRFTGTAVPRTQQARAMPGNRNRLSRARKLMARLKPEPDQRRVEKNSRVRTQG